MAMVMMMMSPIAYSMVVTISMMRITMTVLDPITYTRVRVCMMMMMTMAMMTMAMAMMSPITHTRVRACVDDDGDVDDKPYDDDDDDANDGDDGNLLYYTVL